MQKFVSFSEDFINNYKNKQPQWGFNGLGYIVYKRTYSRALENGKKEEWWQTIQRCIEGAQSIGADYTVDEAERLFDYMFNLKANMAGRFLWQLGTKTVEKLGGPSLMNCWFLKIDDPIKFGIMFDLLMLGGGVGFSVRKEDIYQLPKVKSGVVVTYEKTNDADFIVPDSREGWVNLINLVMNSFFSTGKSFSYSTILVRGMGEKINGFGGIASGPQPLIDGINNIVSVFQKRENKRLRSVDVLDICNIIGSIVVSGNVRRSSQVALGDPDDILYNRAKRWDLGNIPNWRAMSNNSNYFDSYSHITEETWNGYNGNGEPYGFFNLRLSQQFGRLIDGPMKNSSLYPAKRDNCEGGNPCMEQSLADLEGCNLSEIYLNNVTSKEELIDIACLLYKTQKAVINLPQPYPEIEKVVKKNNRLGLGVTGICQSLDKLDWLHDCYEALRKMDKEWSKEKGYNQSLKLTTVKPSGTLSLLAGSTPGVHPGYSRHFTRRVRIATNDPLFENCKAAGYKTEFVINFDGSLDHNTGIIEFPCQFSENTIVASEMSAVDQLELIKKLQTIWSDNAVSCTVYYKLEELPDIKKWMSENFETSIKSVSFLLHSNHGFKQAPYEEISLEKYQSDIKNIKTINVKDNLSLNLDIEDCVGGVCPVR